MTLKLRPYLLLLVAGLLLWAGMTRPLVCHFGRAIPYNERRSPNTPALSAIVPGDHIQLLYHFWLCRDMLAGKTPAFSNVYEFNTGDDDARRQFDTYYIPFSLVYALVSPLFGHAAGWNAAGLFSVLLGLFGFYALARRFLDSDGVAGAVALVAAAFPYRWITLLGGSPTGYASCLVPWLLYGLDKAVRDKRPGGGLVAGLALFFAYCSDLHVFYFSALLTPVWCVFCWFADDAPLRPDATRVRQVLRALLPTILLAGAAVALSVSASGNLAKSTMSGGRDLRELKLFSPIRSGLVRWQSLGPSNHIFAGTGLAILLGLGYLVFGLGLRKGNGTARRGRLCLLAALLTLALTAVVLLALGTYGPCNALPIRLARKLIPKYTMIRQPMKIFCILPPILCVLLALLYRRIASARRLVQVAALLLALAAVGEQVLWFRPALCELPDHLPAYSGAASYARTLADSKSDGERWEKPHAVCIPLWPGDSHFSSIYEYGAMTSRIRLVNGYAPAVPGDYYEGVFSKLSSLNKGVLDEKQRQLLTSIGVNLIIFHEQPYPSKVSPFPSSVALRLLRGNPALREVGGGEGAYAFVFTGAKAEPERGYGESSPDTLFPAAYHWPQSRLTGPGMEQGHARIFRTHMRAPVPIAPGMCYKLLLSGGGRLRGDCGHTVEVPSKLAWVSVPITDPMGEAFTVVEGDPQMRHAFIGAGRAVASSGNATFSWAASDLFHFGYSDGGAVTFEQARNNAGIVLYGPDLPFRAGRYIATIDGDFTDGDTFMVRTVGDGGQQLAVVPLKAGETRANISFRYDGLLPLRLDYAFSGKGRSRVNGFILERGGE
ncbi:MAG: hypothetical protein IJQ73_03410 [Kiritimatiellae bacterium]|nr:hypothetical protein [Kiritimatiellia bacterium]